VDIYRLKALLNSAFIWVSEDSFSRDGGLWGKSLFLGSSFISLVPEKSSSGTIPRTGQKVHRSDFLASATSIPPPKPYHDFIPVLKWEPM
jgi:hypothetical protein